MLTGTGSSSEGGTWTLAETIEAETKVILRSMQIQDLVTETMIYGRRASTCHVLLTPLPEAVKARILTPPLHAQ